MHEAESDDPNGTRWPRTKRHDDEAVVVIDFDRPGPVEQLWPNA